VEFGARGAGEER